MLETPCAICSSNDGLEEMFVFHEMEFNHVVGPCICAKAVPHCQRLPERK